MDTKNPVPVELNDEQLSNVSGGVMSGSMLRSSFTNTVNANDEDRSSGFEGMDIPVGAFMEA